MGNWPTHFPKPLLISGEDSGRDARWILLQGGEKELLKIKLQCKNQVATVPGNGPPCLNVIVNRPLKNPPSTLASASMI